MSDGVRSRLHSASPRCVGSHAQWGQVDPPRHETNHCSSKSAIYAANSYSTDRILPSGSIVSCGSVRRRLRVITSMQRWKRRWFRTPRSLVCTAFGQSSYFAIVYLNFDFGMYAIKIHAFSLMLDRVDLSRLAKLMYTLWAATSPECIDNTVESLAKYTPPSVVPGGKLFCKISGLASPTNFCLFTHLPFVPGICCPRIPN